MLSLYAMLQSWVATPTGMVTLAIIFGLGLVVAFFMVVVTFNVHSELKQFGEKYDHDVQALKTNLDTQKGNFDAESRKFAETIATLNRNNELLRNDLETSKQVLDEKSQELKKEREAVRIYKGELAEEIATSNNIRRGTLGLGKLLANAIKSRAVETRTFLVAGGTDDSGKDQVVFSNITESVKGLKPTTDIETYNLAETMQVAKEKIDEDPNYEGFEKAAAALYHNSLQQLMSITPVYFFSILYIRTLGIKLVLTDYNFFTDLSLRETDLVVKEKAMRESIRETIKGTIRNDDSDIIIINPEFANALGSDFRGVKLFNDKYVEQMKNISHVKDDLVA